MAWLGNKSSVWISGCVQFKAGVVPNGTWTSFPLLPLFLVPSPPFTSFFSLLLSLFHLMLLPFPLPPLLLPTTPSGHPYLTGLAIAGGIYFAGLEGALIGPILLCCLLFVVDLYGDMLNNWSPKTIPLFIFVYIMIFIMVAICSLQPTSLVTCLAK